LTALILRVRVVWPTGGIRLASGSHVEQNGNVVRLLDKRSVTLSGKRGNSDYNIVNFDHFRLLDRDMRV
jgi:hypothetical protein